MRSRGDTVAALADIGRALEISKICSSVTRLLRSGDESKRRRWNEAEYDKDEAIKLRPQETSFLCQPSLPAV